MLLQFVDIAHECQSAAKTAATHVRVHQTLMQDLSKIMRKSNVLAAQVEVLMQEQG